MQKRRDELLARLVFVSTTLATLPAMVALADEPPLPRDSASTIARARSFHEALSNADSSALWAAFNETMRSAVGSAETFDGTLAALIAQTGRLEHCLSEEAKYEAGAWVYRARCTFSRSDLPQTLTITFDGSGKLAGLLIRAETRPHATPHLDYQTRASLRLPFEGEWLVAWGGRTPDQNYHVVSRDQRFAYDFLIHRSGKSHRTDGRTNADFYCFGQSILAPAAGKVVWLTDGLPDNRPGEMNPKHPVGNGVVLDHGRGEFSVMGHFQRGTVRVELDQRVEAGDVLALCGNSGNSSEPHLHYHLQDRPEPYAGDGLPAFFRDYVADGQPVERGEPVRGQQVSREIGP